MFYRLDINDFFDEKYEKLNHASGIGAMGFITSNQSIHLYNDYGLDKKSNTYYLGIGDHYWYFVLALILPLIKFEPTRQHSFGLVEKEETYERINED